MAALPQQIPRPTREPQPDFAAWMRERLAHFEQCAQCQLPPAERIPEQLHEAMRYAVLDGGKRVRPLLVYAAAEVGTASRAGADAAALAVEFVHAYSLIHDDLPCMDNDVLRRGKPTVHVAFNEATAMLAGDALQAEAFHVLAEAPVPAAVRVRLIARLAQASGTAGMCGGQAIDLSAVGRSLTLPQLEQMHRMKTGALLEAAVAMGAMAADCDEAATQALLRYGTAIGLAFQIVDDVLDVEQSSAALGKTAGKDAAADKPTYVSLVGLDAAKQWARQLHREALAALAPLEPRAGRLRQLADFIVVRKH